MEAGLDTDSRQKWSIQEGGRFWTTWCLFRKIVTPIPPPPSLSLSLSLSLCSLSLPQVTPGLGRLAMKLLGPCTFSQAAIPHIFENVPRSYLQRNMEVFEKNAKVCYQMLKDVPGISPIMPAGAMYMMVGYIN